MMNILRLQQTLERVAGLMRSETRNMLLQYGLQPVHFEALSYLASCNRYSDTPMAVTEFLGQTKGSVSQTLNVLEKKGLMRKTPDKNDKRVTRLKLSAKGARLVRDLQPSPLLKAACDELPESDWNETLAKINGLLQGIQSANEFKSFGQCSSCMHNSRKNNQTYCGLTEEPLSVRDVQLICREHAAA